MNTADISIRLYVLQIPVLHLKPVNMKFLRHPIYCNFHDTFVVLKGGKRYLFILRDLELKFRVVTCYSILSFHTFDIFYVKWQTRDTVSISGSLNSFSVYIVIVPTSQTVYRGYAFSTFRLPLFVCVCVFFVHASSFSGRKFSAFISMDTYKRALVF